MDKGFKVNEDKGLGWALSRFFSCPNYHLEREMKVWTVLIIRNFKMGNQC